MKRLALSVFSIAFLALLYWVVDPGAVLRVLSAARVGPLLAAVLLLALAHILSALRLSLLVPTARRLGLAESLRLILAAAVLNLVVPAKGGDLLKSAFMRGRAGLDGPLALALVGFEKATDLLALLLWCAFGLVWEWQHQRAHGWLLALALAGLCLGIGMLASSRLAATLLGAARRIAPLRARRALLSLENSWEIMRAYYWREPLRLLRVVLISLTIWLLHLLQIWLFALALGADLPLATGLALAPLAILAGLLPITLAGVGTRDAALIALFRGYMDPATGAALGLLATLRYLLPGLVGLPVLPRYLGELRAGGAAEPAASSPPGDSRRR